MVHETRGFVRDANLPFALWSLNLKMDKNQLYVISKY